MTTQHPLDHTVIDDVPGRQTHRKTSAYLLEMLVCPVTHTMLRYDVEAQELVSDRARLAYPIRDGIPIMLVEEARTLDD
jgi:uncharacterized protein YbaR (Trm112 family)